MKNLIDFYKKKQTTKYKILEIILEMLLQLEDDSKQIIKNVKAITNMIIKEEKNKINSQLINDLYNLRQKNKKLLVLIEKGINTTKNSQFAKDLIIFAINPLNKAKISQLETLNNNPQLLILKLNEFILFFPNMKSNLNNLKSFSLDYFQ